MAHALQIDTLAFSEKLRAAGADENLAKAIVEGITAADTSELATKSDLATLEHALKSDLATLEHALKSDITEVKADIARVEHTLKAEISEVRVEISKIGNRTALLIGGFITFLFMIDRLIPFLDASVS